MFQQFKHLLTKGISHVKLSRYNLFSPSGKKLLNKNRNKFNKTFPFFSKFTQSCINIKPLLITGGTLFTLYTSYVAYDKYYNYKYNKFIKLLDNTNLDDDVFNGDIIDRDSNDDISIDQVYFSLTRFYKNKLLNSNYWWRIASQEMWQDALKYNTSLARILAYDLDLYYTNKNDKYASVIAYKIITEKEKYPQLFFTLSKSKRNQKKDDLIDKIKGDHNFNNIFNLKHYVMSGEDLLDILNRANYSPIFAKRIPSDRVVTKTLDLGKKNIFFYKNGRNTDHNTFDPMCDCCAGGLYFTTNDEIGSYQSYGSLQATVQIVNSPNIYYKIEQGKIKGTSIYLSNIVDTTNPNDDNDDDDDDDE